MAEELAAPLTIEEVTRLRADFPILSREMNGQPLIYLDSGATSQTPQCVWDAEQQFYESFNAAVHRGAHSLAVEATDLYEEARATVARFIGASERELVWTSNATEALNLIAYSFSNASLGRGGDATKPFRLSPGDEILTTEIEHHANLLPWQELAARTGATFRYVPVLADGSIDYDAAAHLVGPRTKIFAFTHVSNVLGVVTDVARLVALAKGVGAFTVLDACQSTPHMKLDVKALDVDFAAFSGHKMLGPTGIGGLYGRAELLDVMPPFLVGGSMITKVTMEGAEYLPAPTRFEAGTQRISQTIALTAAVNYLDEVGLDRIAAWEHQLGQQLVDGLSQIPGVRVLGPTDVPRIGVAAFDVEGVHPHDVGQYLDSVGIAIRVGHHCAQPLHRKLGLAATSRASTYLYSLPSEVDELVRRVAEVRPFFGLS